MPERELVLASLSPRRKELLSIFPRKFSVVGADCDETIEAGSSVRDAVETLARRKALCAAALVGHALVIGADTLVEFEGRALPKPCDVQEAREMLRALSGKTHRVYTGICVVSCPDGKTVSAAEETSVTFQTLPDELIEQYIATGEPLDKAGAYGIQGMGGIFVKEIRGDFQNVVGLPVAKLYGILKHDFGFDLLREDQIDVCKRPRD